MSQPILLLGAKQLLTLRGKPGVRRGTDSGVLEVIEDGSVFIQDGKIACVGPTRRLENLKDIKGALQIRAQNCVVMPGFVDSSLKLSLLSATGDGQPGVKRRKLRHFYEESIDLMRRCLQHGTLNAGIRACSGVHSIGADLSVLRQVARIRNSPIGLTRFWSPDLDPENMPGRDTLAAAFDTIWKQKLSDAIGLPAKFCRPLAGEADKSRLRINLEWQGGTAESLRQALQNSTVETVFCSSELSASECEVLAHTKAAAVFSAGGNLLEGERRNSVRELLDAGGAIALGSGYDALYETNFNMQLVLVLAVKRLNLTIEQAIVATTVNAAYAMNCGDQIGSLEPGKRADLVILNLSDYREIPLRMGINHLAMAIREGIIVINRTDWKVGVA